MNNTRDVILVNRCNQSDEFRTVLPAKMCARVLLILMLAAAAVLLVGAEAAATGCAEEGESIWAVNEGVTLFRDGNTMLSPLVLSVFPSGNDAPLSVAEVSSSSLKIAVYSDYMSISDTSSSGLSAYADALRAQGYTVEQIYDPITSSKLDGCEALLMIGLGRYLSSSEKSAIEDFVETQDKGLLLSGGSSGAVNDLSQNFTGGSEWFGSNIVCDPTDYEVYPKWVKIQTFYDHPITENLGRIIMYKGTNIPAACAFGGIIGCAYSDDDSWLDEDGDYVYDSGESRGAQPVLAYSSWDKIVVVPDTNVFDNSDADGDGVVAFYEYDNDVLGLNVARWLVGEASGAQVQVTDAKIIRGEIVGDWFQEIEEVDELKVGDVFIIKIEVTNFGSETEEVFNLYDWDLSPQTRVDVIGTPSFCLYPFNLQPGESAILYPFCLSEAFEAEEEGWVTMNVLEYDGYTFSFEIIAEEAVNFIGVVENEPSAPYDIEVRIDEIILDPEGTLSEGDLAQVDIAEDPSECDVVWPVHKGDRVEVFAKHYDYDCWLPSYDICVWIYSKDSAYDGYLKLLEEERVHNINTGKSFSKIQYAIDDSGTGYGHTILVDPGTYSENVDVYKSLTIKSTSGSPEDTIVQAAVSNQNVFTVTADNVKIDSFTIRGASSYWCSGIWINSDDCIISNNTFEDNAIGIWTHPPSGNDNTIRNNNFVSSSGYSPSTALYIESSDNKIYLNNFFIGATGGGSYFSTLWHSPEQITYEYEGGIFTSHLGNHWGSYSDVDDGNDGIWDHSYSINDDDTDYYPLVERFENYKEINQIDTINFSGHTWSVRHSSESPQGPGNNYWSNSTENIWVDDEGQLHLKITYRNGKWYCPEIFSKESFGYGKYVFYVASRVDNFDENVVGGLFTYEGRGETTPKEYEIDIEFSRWGIETNNNSLHVFQYRIADGDPATDDEPNEIDPNSFNISLNGEYSTHAFGDFLLSSGNWSNPPIVYRPINLYL